MTGVIRCKECDMPMYAPGLTSCQSAHWDSTSPEGINAVMHTWVNIHNGDEDDYNCKCGKHFDTHEELMKHTAELNPKLDTLTMGRAGASIEREAHEKTFDLLRRARKALKLIDYALDGTACDNFEETNPDLVSIQLQEIEPTLQAIRDQCPIFAIEDSEAFDKSIEDHIEKGNFLTLEQRLEANPLPPEEEYYDNE